MTAPETLQAPAARLVEVRTYLLRPGCAAAFVAAFDVALPLLRAAGMDVVAFGRSDHEDESFHLIRAYADRDDLERRQAAFYASEAWRKGPREALVACIDRYANTLLWMSQAGVDDLRARNGIRG